MKLLIAFAFLILIGCVKPVSIAGGAPEETESGIVDTDLLAGATSSTNWPAEDVFPNRISVLGRADSQLVIRFYEIIGPIKVSGRITLFKGGVIPVLDSVPLTTFLFSDQDTLLIPESAFMPLREKDSDTVRFSLKIETDTSECFFLGFAYSIRQNAFITSPFSILSLSSAILTKSHYSFKGRVDSALGLLGPSFAGKSEWCFYIPGTPFFWKADRVKSGEILEVGQLPTGSYPLRLIRVLAQEANQRMNLLEVYSIKVTVDSTTIPWNYVMGLGNRILAHEISNANSILPETK